MNILKELNKLGYEVDRGLYQILNYNNFKNAVPVLMEYLRYLKKSNDINEKKEVVRVLSKRFAKSDELCELLLDEFKNSNNFNHRWGIGNAMCYVLTKSYIAKVITIINDKSYERTREMFVISLSRFKTPEVQNTLLKLLEKDDLTSHTLESVRRMNFKEAQSLVEKYIKDKRKLVQKEAQKTFIKLLK